MAGFDDYLDQLAGRLRLTPEASRRLLDEADSHLQDAADAEVVRGADRVRAEGLAIARFGTPAEVARTANGGLGDLLGAGLRSVAPLVAVGCAAVLAGTLLAHALAWVTSTNWVFGPQTSFTPSATRAAYWLQVQPSAHSWHSAATLENASDSLVLRGGAALLGLVCAWAVLRLTRRRATVGAGLVPAVGMASFGIVAVLLLTGSLSGLDWGRGQQVCDGLIALVLAGWYAVVCARSALTTNASG